MGSPNEINCEIQQKPLNCSKNCSWHGDKPLGKRFNSDEIFSSKCCPLLYHSVYPYFLGLLYGAKFSWNDRGDCNTNCPAADGVDVIVKKRDNDGSFDPRIGDDMQYVIFAEIVKVRGHCPQGHQVGDRIIFPTSMIEGHMCPAALNNVFPLLDLDVPSCIDRSNLRCPDYDDVIIFDVVRGQDHG